MKQKTPFHANLALLCLLILSNPVFSGTTAQAIEADKQDIHNLISTMNQAVTNRDLDAVLATFDENALKLDLFPAHYPPKTDKTPATQKPIQVFPKTANLKARWQAVFGIMGNVKVYERSATLIQSQVDGKMASAWVEIKTKTITREGAAETRNRFIEIVLLKKVGRQWKIVLTSNNRHD